MVDTSQDVKHIRAIIHTINAQDSIVFHGSMCATREWIVQEDSMKGNVTGSSALISGNLGVGIRQYVWHWKMFVMVLMIALSKRMSIFVIFFQRNVHSSAPAFYLLFWRNLHGSQSTE